MKTLTLSVITGLIILSIPVRAQYITKYPEIPRIDVHSHVNNNYPAISAYLAATDQYYNLVNRENLRDLFIEYADRILFGTDVGGYNNSAIPNNVTRYANSFQILETEDIVGSGFFGSKPTTGLNLPKEVLEKIYYKNAMKLYPGLSERMRRLGYKV